MEAWRAFAVYFHNLVQESRVSEEEGSEKLLDKIGGLRNWVIEKEVKEERKAPTVELTFPMQFYREEILGFLHDQVVCRQRTL